MAKRRESGQNGSGRDSRVVPIEVGKGARPLTDEEASNLRALEKLCVDSKLELANTRIKIKLLERQENELAQQAVNAMKAFDEAVKAACEAHGIDRDDPKKGRWELVTKTGMFIPTAPPTNG